MLFNHNLISKYDKPGPRYTSYPPANFFQSGFGEEEYINQLKISNLQSSRNVSFYFHVPFCPQLCHFCGCNTDLMRNKDFVVRYFNAIKIEFEKIAQQIDKTRPVTQIHWGGGTPNSVSLSLIAEVMALVKSHFILSDNADLAMECNPAHLTLMQIDALSEIGFNRISIGIQDFNPEVLKIINRRESKLPVVDVVNYMKSKNIHVNLDFVYGLPAQTTESFTETIQKAIEIEPDRIVTFSYAHVPWVKEAQKKLEKHEIPNANSKLSMFEKAYNLITSAGYNSIGLDHFAKPNDEMTIALNNRTLHRNFMGYCTQTQTGQVYGLGSTAITQLDGAYIQNIKNTEEYITAIENGNLAPVKGYILTQQDKICRAVIEELMCNYYINLHHIAESFSMNYNQIIEQLGFKSENLGPFIEDQLISWQNGELTIFDEGKFVLRNIAMLFDPLLLQSNTSMKYSKTI